MIKKTCHEIAARIWRYKEYIENIDLQIDQTLVDKIADLLYEHISKPKLGDLVRINKPGTYLHNVEGIYVEIGCGNAVIKQQLEDIIVKIYINPKYLEKVNT